MDTLLTILKFVLIGVITPIGAGLVIWELVQAVLGRPLKHTSPAAPEAEAAEGGE